MIGPNDTPVLWDADSGTVDVYIFPLHASLRLRAGDLGATCHQDFGSVRCDMRIARGLSVTKVASSR